MGFIHQLAEFNHIVGFQSFYGFERTVVFEHCMTRTLTFQRFADGTGQLIERFIGKLAQSIQFRLYFLQFVQRVFTLRTTHIIGTGSKAMGLIGIGNHNAGPL